MKSLTVARAPRVQYRDLDDEGVLLHSDTGECFALDASANRTWQLLMELGSVDRVVDALGAEYLTPTATLRADVDELVRQLAGKQLITIVADR